MAEKLFNEYYTKNFELPGQFTALNGAIQYFELTSPVALMVEPVKETATKDEKAKNVAEMAAARANYLRVLEILRSRGAQPIITSVDDKTLGFTLEQTWVYGESMKENVAKEQVSAHDLLQETKDVVAKLFEGIKFFARGDKNIGTEDEPAYEVEEKEVTGKFSIAVKATAGSLVSNAKDEA